MESYEFGSKRAYLITSGERPKSAPYLRLNKSSESLGENRKKMGKNKNVKSEL